MYIYALYISNLISLFLYFLKLKLLLMKVKIYSLEMCSNVWKIKIKETYHIRTFFLHDSHLYPISSRRSLEK